MIEEKNPKTTRKQKLKTPAYQSVSRTARLVKYFIVAHQDIAGSADRSEKLRLPGQFDLFTKTAYMDFHYVGRGIEVVAPDVPQDLLARYDLVLVSHEVFEKAELLRLKLYFFFLAAGAAGNEIQRKVGNFELHRLVASLGSPDEAFYAGQELRKDERFDQIVITSALKSEHAIINAALRAQNENRCIDSLIPQLPQQFQAILSGEHEIEHQDIMGSLSGYRETVNAVRGDLDLEFGFRQSLAYEIGSAQIVLYDEDAPSFICVHVKASIE
jgi:hypothetical protein